MILDSSDHYDAISANLDRATRALDLAQLAFHPVTEHRTTRNALLERHRDLLAVSSSVLDASHALALAAEELRKDYAKTPGDPSVLELAKQEFALRKRIVALSAPVEANLVVVQAGLVASLTAAQGTDTRRRTGLRDAP